MCENTNDVNQMATDNRDLSPLFLDRHPQFDFFVCDIFDAAPKSDTASIEHPLFSLSTRPDYTRKEYTEGVYAIGY